MVEGCDRGNPKSFCNCDDRCIYSAQWQRPIFGYKFGDAQPVGRMNPLNRKNAAREVTQESNLRVDAQPARDQTDDFRGGELGDEKWSGVGLNEVEASRVMPDIDIDVGVQWALIDEDGYPAVSEPSISSIPRYH